MNDLMVDLVVRGSPQMDEKLKTALAHSRISVMNACLMNRRDPAQGAVMICLIIPDVPDDVDMNVSTETIVVAKQFNRKLLALLTGEEEDDA